MKVLVSPSSFGQCGDEPLNLLKDNGYEVINNPYGRKLTEDEVIDLAKECIGIVAGVEPLNKKVMDNLTSLKCISRVGVGMESVDLEYAETKGIKVVNTPDGPTRPVAELTVGLVFDLLRKISVADSNIKKGVWKKEIGFLLENKLIGIIGLGRIGKTVAKFFNGLGNKVIAFDLYKDEKWAEENGVEYYDIDLLLEKADIVTIHIPGNKDKKPVLSTNQLSLFKPTAFLVNIARGGVVDEEALYEVLKNKKIAGAALDVFAKEPYDGKLKELDNVVLTPHLGSYAGEAKLKMEVDAVKNLINELK